MAEITDKRQGEIIQTLFEILAKHPEGLQAKDAIAAVQDQMELTEFEKGTFPNEPDKMRFPKLVRFATINSVKAGWLLKSNGIWTVTDEGKAATEEFKDPEAFYKQSRQLYKAWKASQPESESAHSEEGGEDSGLISATSIEEAEESAREAIRSYLGTMNPYTFQDLVGRLLEAMGYHVVWISPKGQDGGLDLLAQSDPLGVKGPRIKGQVKRVAAKVSEEELRSFLSLVDDGDVGVFIALSGFTKNASDLSRRSSRRITLIDGDQLFDLWVEHYDELEDDGQQLLPVKPIYFLDSD